MAFVKFIIDAIGNNLVISYSIVGVLLAAFFTIRYNEFNTKRKKFEKAYSVFKEAIDPVIYQIKNGDTLNLVILGAYPKHETAMTAFIPNLNGFRRKRFKKKWNEYASIITNLKAWDTLFLSLAPLFFRMRTVLLIRQALNVMKQNEEKRSLLSIKTCLI